MARRAEQARGVKQGYMATGKVLSLYISSYDELNPSKSPFCLDPVFGVLVSTGEY